MEKYLILLLLITFVSGDSTYDAALHYLRVNDLTGHDYAYYDVFQYDNLSNHYTKTVNLTSEDMAVLSVNHDYRILVNTNTAGVFGNMNNSKTVDYIMSNIIWIIGAVLILLLTGAVVR